MISWQRKLTVCALQLPLLVHFEYDEEQGSDGHHYDPIDMFQFAAGVPPQRTRQPQPLVRRFEAMHSYVPPPLAQHGADPYGRRAQLSNYAIPRVPRDPIPRDCDRRVSASLRPTGAAASPLAESAPRSAAQSIAGPSRPRQKVKKAVDQVELPFILNDLPEDAKLYWGRYAAKVQADYRFAKTVWTTMATLRMQSPVVRDRATASCSRSSAATFETQNKIKLLEVSHANLTAELLKAKTSLEEALTAQARSDKVAYGKWPHGPGRHAGDSSEEESSAGGKRRKVPPSDITADGKRPVTPDPKRAETDDNLS